MKTTDLVSLLAADTLPVAHEATRRRLSQAPLLGLPLALANVLIGYGPRRDLQQAGFWPMFRVTLAVPVTVALASFTALQCLARLGRDWTQVGLGWSRRC